MSHVCFICDHRIGSISGHVRGYQIMPALQTLGWRTSYVSFHEQQIPDADVYYIIKVPYPDRIKALQGKKVFDLNDALWRSYHAPQGWGCVNEILSSVDAVVAEHKYIAEYARQFNHTYVVPSAVPLEEFDASGRVKDPETITVGWLGSFSTWSGCSRIMPQIDEAMKTCPNLRFQTLGRGSYTESEMVDIVSKWDVGLCPICVDVEDYLMRGALKGTVYMAAGAMPVCEPIGEYADVITVQETGWFSTSDIWDCTLVAIAKSPMAVREMGQKALAYIRPLRSRQAVAKQLDEVLKAVLDGSH